MMKKVFTLILFLCISSVSFGQIYEIGFFLGGTNYIGDVGSDFYINPNRVGGGVVFKYNVNPRIALRGNFTYIPLLGDDARSDNSFRRERNFRFSNNVFELAAGVEFNFFDYQNKAKENLQHTPYILAQVAVFNYNTIGNLVDNFSDGNLDLSTSNFDNNYSVTLPVGIGYKGRLGRNVAYAIESGIRFTVVDELDFTTDEFVGTPAGDQLDFEGNGNDFYVFTGFSLVYTFGRPPCYAPLD